MIELKPCPFCGGKGEYQEDGSYAWAECLTCGATGKTFLFLPAPNDGGRKAVIKNWNTRPVEDALQARIAELEAQLAERAGVCIWQPDEGFDYTCINTACHQSYVFEDGYEDGDDTYCSHCGRKIRFNPNPEPQEGKE